QLPLLLVRLQVNMLLGEVLLKEFYIQKKRQEVKTFLTLLRCYDALYYSADSSVVDSSAEASCVDSSEVSDTSPDSTGSILFVVSLSVPVGFDTINVPLTIVTVSGIPFHSRNSSKLI